MWAERVRRVRNGEDDGFAMIVAMLVTTIVLVMTLGMLATGIHLQTATARDLRWNRALQVAEAGVDRAVYELQKSDAYAGSGGPVAGPGGEYETTVSTPKVGWRVVTSIGYVPSKAAPNVVKRKVQVTYGPYASFKYALFSDTGLEVKNNNGTTGDVFANGSIVMKQNSGVKGSVTSALGTIYMENNAKIQKNGSEGGDAYTGGYDASGKWGLFLSNGATVDGNAFAQVETCQNDRYDIKNSGLIKGNAVAAGSINGSVTGTKTPFNCQPRQPSKNLPEYHYDPDLYGTVSEYASAAAFQSWADAHSASLTGTHRVNDPNPNNIIDLGAKTITGNFTLITNTLIDFNNNTSYSGPSDAYVSLVSLNSSTDPPAINIKNNFTIPDPSPAVLVYSTGTIFVKNNAESNGAVYAGAISIKNNLDVTYDPRVERTVGFGPVRYQRVSWQELKP